MIVIKSFLTGIFYDCFELICMYLNEWNRVCECYSCLMIQGHLHLSFMTIFFIKPASIKLFYLYMKLLQSSTIFKENIIMKCLAIKIFALNFLQLQIQKINYNSTHSYNRNISGDIPPCIIFPWYKYNYYSLFSYWHPKLASALR